MTATADKIEASFRALLEKSDYRSVSVIDICQDIDISRKTFYVYFHDRRAIVEHIFERDVVRSTRELLDLVGFEQVRRLHPSAQERQFRAIFDDGDYYKSLVVPRRGGDEAFLGVARDNFCELNRAMLSQCRISGADSKKDYIAWYFASAKADLLLKWIREDYNMSVRQIARLYEEVALPFWNTLEIEGGGAHKPLIVVILATKGTAPFVQGWCATLN